MNINKNKLNKKVLIAITCMECTDCDYQTYLLLEKKSAMKLRYLGSFDEK